MKPSFFAYLPWPPTVNSYYSAGRGGQRFLSRLGRLYGDAVGRELNEQLPNIRLEYKLNLEVILHPPDSRTRDIDNYLKALLDACTKCGLWVDDSQIDQLVVLRGEILKPKGIVRIEINEAGPLVPALLAEKPARARTAP